VKDTDFAVPMLAVTLVFAPSSAVMCFVLDFCVTPDCVNFCSGGTCPRSTLFTELSTMQHYCGNEESHTLLHHASSQGSWQETQLIQEHCQPGLDSHIQSADQHDLQFWC